MTEEKREPWFTKYLNDPRSTGELIGLLLVTDEDDPAYYDMLSVLYFRGTRKVFDAALVLCRSASPAERYLGVGILMKQGESARMLREAQAYLASPPKGTTRDAHARENYTTTVAELSGTIGTAREYNEEAVAELLRLLDEETDTHVLAEVVSALGWYKEDYPCLYDRLMPYVHHPAGEVRFWLAMNFTANHSKALEILIILSTDKDEAVRDWATFGLAQLEEDDQPFDTPQIRDALAARVHDTDAMVRYEAFRGLANRADPRVVEPLAEEPLTLDTDGTFFEALVEAGKRLGDPRLLPALQWFQAHGYTSENYHYDASEDENVAEAIARCTQADTVPERHTFKSPG